MAVIAVESMAVKGDDSQSNFWQSNTVQLPAKSHNRFVAKKSLMQFHRQPSFGHSNDKFNVSPSFPLATECQMLL